MKRVSSRSTYRTHPVAERRRVMLIQWVGLIVLLALTGYLVMKARQAT